MQIVRIALTEKYDSPIVYAIDEDDRYTVIESPFSEQNRGNIVRTGEILGKNKRVVLAPCEPTKIVGVDINYERIIEDGRSDWPSVPEIFLLPSTCVIGTSEPIAFPRQSQRVGFSVEIAVVIGTKAKNVTENEADTFIFGFTGINNATANDIFSRNRNYPHAAGFDGTMSCGPCINTSFNIENKRMQLRVGSKEYQDYTTDGMLFSPTFLVSYASKIMTLMPGDIILTGAPSQNAELKSGEVVVAEVEGIGELSNVII